MTEYGTEKTTSTTNGDQISEVVKYRRGEPVRTLRSYRVKVRVSGSQDEMSEFIRFTDELTKLRYKSKLAVDREDPDTFPAFILQYPKDDADGSYFIIKCYTVVV